MDWLHSAVAFSTTHDGHLAIGLVFLAWAALRFMTAARCYANYGSFPFNKGIGTNAATLCRLNAAIGLFFVILIFDVVMRMAALQDPANSYTVAYTPLVLVTSLVALFFLVTAYAHIVIRGFDKGTATVRRRLQTVHRCFADRGVSELDLLLVPVASIAAAYAPILLAWLDRVRV